MAKRKKHPVKRRSTTRRRKMSGLPGGMMGTMEDVLGMAAGAVLATAVQRQATQFNPKIVALLGIGAGVFGKHHFKGPFMQGAANGVITVSAVHLVHDVGIIHGVENMMAGLFDGVAGPGDTRETIEFPVNGFNNMQMVAGLDNMNTVAGNGFI